MANGMPGKTAARTEVENPSAGYRGHELRYGQRM